jgi:hypothetical protein
MALCTQADVEAKLQWDITADPDPVVTALITDAQALIEAEVGRTLESAATTELIDGGGAAIFLSRFPVTAITTVTEDGTVLTAGADYLLYEKAGKLIRVSGSHQIYWRTTKAQGIEVVYTGGYLLADHPSELEHLGSICAEVVARAFRRGADSAAIPAGAAGAIQSLALDGSDSVTYATSGEGAGGGGLNAFVFLTDDERTQLDRYKRRWLGFA